MVMTKIGKVIVKTLFSISAVGVLALPLMMGHFAVPSHPLSRVEATDDESFIVETFEFSETIEQPEIDLLEVIPEFVTTPEGGTSWNVFGETKENEYSYSVDGEYDFMGVKPEFSENLKKLDGQTIIIQGYMFPLGQEEAQATFLLGPFPLSCPYHYHVPPKLLLEVHAKTPIQFSYDAVNIQGALELVPNDDEYNVFYRLKDATLLKQ